MKIDIETLSKYSKPGPRYTSYPTAPVFNDEFTVQDYHEIIGARDRSHIPLSLYFHLPFCTSVCFFCACNVIYTKNAARTAPYLDLLREEMRMLASELDPARVVKQLHWGGGTPSFLTPEEMAALWKDITTYFTIAPDAEISVELDPRSTTAEHVEVLAKCGFNRASLGVQDLDPRVQEAVNRIQPLEMSRELAAQLRAKNFHGVNVDLIYGLPEQTLGSFEHTLDEILELKPDRISLFHFAYLPHLKKHQKRIDEGALPSTETKLEIFKMATERFLEAGYRYIGMDHFALPDDEMSVAQENRRLHRNFQGYTICRDCDLLGIGVTSIGEAGGAFIQNQKDMKAYEEAISSGSLAVYRGHKRTRDDEIRRRVILELICNFELHFSEVEAEFDINFQEYFAEELPGLQPFMEDELLIQEGDVIRVTEAGRYVIRNICMVFDAYLKTLETRGQKFSKTV